MIQHLPEVIPGPRLISPGAIQVRMIEGIARNHFISTWPKLDAFLLQCSKALLALVQGLHHLDDHLDVQYYSRAVLQKTGTV